MIAFFSEGMPSVGEYLMSPVLSLAAELRMALSGAFVLWFAHPIAHGLAALPQLLRFLVELQRRRFGDGFGKRAQTHQMLLSKSGIQAQSRRDEVEGCTLAF